MHQVKVNNFVCELQLNLDAVLDIKESGAGHKVSRAPAQDIRQGAWMVLRGRCGVHERAPRKRYEQERMINDNMIFATMVNKSVPLSVPPLQCPPQ